MNADWKHARIYLSLIAALLVVMVIFGVKDQAPAADRTTTLDLATALAPFVAIAAAIERFWESVFSWYESFAIAVGRVLGVNGKLMEWVRTEYELARDALATAPKGSEMLAAEMRLKEAQARIHEALKLPEYVAMKKAIILFGSLVLGVGIAVSGNLQFFHAAAMKSFPAPIDVLLTGLIIGLGPGPVHDLITLLQELKNAVAGIADLARGAAVKKATENLRVPIDTGENEPEPQLTLERTAQRMLNPR